MSIERVGPSALPTLTEPTAATAVATPDASEVEPNRAEEALFGSR